MRNVNDRKDNKEKVNSELEVIKHFMMKNVLVCQ